MRKFLALARRSNSNWICRVFKTSKKNYLHVLLATQLSIEWIFSFSFSLNCFRWCPMHNKNSNNGTRWSNFVSVRDKTDLRVVKNAFEQTYWEKLTLSMICGISHSLSFKFLVLLNIVIIDFHFTCFLSPSRPQTTTTTSSIARRKAKRKMLIIIVDDFVKLTLYCTYFSPSLSSFFICREYFV